MSNTNNNTKNNNDSQPQEELWFGGYKGGMLRWNTMRKRSKYTRRYNNNKDNKMMRRILLTRIHCSQRMTSHLLREGVSHHFLILTSMVIVSVR
jgi:hypothetical protein